MNIKFLKDLENEILRSENTRGSVYSPVNSDWTISLNYITDSVYHELFNFYILL